MKENTQEKSPIKQNILLYLTRKGVTPYEFYKKSGVTRGILTQNNGINEDNLARFLAFAPDINLSWLLTGEGDMLKEQPRRPEAATHTPKHISTAGGSERSIEPLHESSAKIPGAIPLVSEQAVGGFSNEHFSISESDILSYYTIPKFRHLNVDFMIELVGDSMMPKFFPGDIIACSTIDHMRYIEWNKPHLIATRDRGLLVKRVMPSTDDNALTAVSDNKDYPPFDIPKEDITGMARIVGVIHIE